MPYLCYCHSRSISAIHHHCQSKNFLHFTSVGQPVNALIVSSPIFHSYFTSQCLHTMSKASPSTKMTLQAKTRTERELEVAKMNARDLRSSNQRLSRQLDDKNFELLAKNQEIERLKSLIANRDANPLESTHDKTVSHTHPGWQQKDRQPRGHHNSRDQHDTDAMRRQPRFLPEIGQHLKALQQVLEDTEKEKEGLQRVCLERDNRVRELEVELTRVLHENEVQHSRFEDCLGEIASLNQKHGYLTESYEKLQAVSPKVARLKRSLATYLRDVGFPQDDFMAGLEQQGPMAILLKDNLRSGNPSNDHPATPVKHCTAALEVMQPDSSTIRMAFSTANFEASHEDTLPSEIDDNTIVVARKLKEARADSTSHILQPSIEVVPRDMNIAEDEQTDFGDDDDSFDIDIDAEGTAFESETDLASEYDPEMDSNGRTDSDGDLTSAEDSDYAP